MPPRSTYTDQVDTLLPSETTVVRRIVAEHKGRPGPLLEVLHAIQAAMGCIPAAAIPVVAEELNLSRAEVHGVVTFYHYFRTARPGAHTVSLCQAEACQSMGAEGLAAHVRHRLGIDFHETTADGKFSLEPVYCLGNCACSPAAMINGELHGRLTADAFDALIKETAST
jgi:formate dehydrogenase subunit gamma